MKQTFKKRGQKFSKRLEHFSAQAKESSREHLQENLIRRLPNARQVRLLILEWGLLVVVVISLALTQLFCIINLTRQKLMSTAALTLRLPLEILRP